MDFKHIPTRPDGGGRLEITVVTPEEFDWLACGTSPIAADPRLRKDLVAQSRVLVSLADGTPYRYEHEAKRPWYRVEGSLPADYSRPYTQLLQRLTGFNFVGAGMDLDLLPMLGLKRALHTHLLDHLVLLADGTIPFVALVQSQDWDGKPAAERAPVRALECVQGDVGVAAGYTPSMERMSNGLYREVPSRRTKPEPGLTSVVIWRGIFGWWRRTHASPAQEKLLQESEAYHRSITISDNEFDIRECGAKTAYLVSDRGLSSAELDERKCHKVVPWEQFKSL